MLFIGITKKDGALGVPYSRLPEDRASHSYVDLKQSPEAIEEIPEVRDWPELRNALIEINGPGTKFRTLGCEKGVISQGEGAHGVSGYVQICFNDLTQAKNAESYVALFERFRSYSKGWPDNDTLAGFEMQPTIFIERDETCWSFVFWLIIRNGESSEAAKEKWSGALKFFREFLLTDD